MAPLCTEGVLLDDTPSPEWHSGVCVGDDSTKDPTIADIDARRQAFGKMVAPTAAYADSDMFKLHCSRSSNKPLARRWESHLTAECLIRAPGILKVAARFLKRPGMISLAGGLPSPDCFPFNSISASIPAIPSPNGGKVSEAESTITMGLHDIASEDAAFDLSVSLNYGQAAGSAQMIRWITEHTELVHNPPYADWDTCLTTGNTAGIYQALRMLCDKNRGDSWMTEEYCYASALETALPMGIKTVGIKMDADGPIPEVMDELLTNWDASKRGARKPHVLYTVPTGQNPTGLTQSAARKRAIYEVCQKHDIYIIEDDPYYFVQLRSHASKSNPEDKRSKLSVGQFLASLPSSFLSIDTDGRVMRIDSFSKIIVPGARMGWVTASEQMTERFIRHAETASQGPSGFSQSIIYKLVDEKWGHEGFLNWLQHLQLEYTNRRDVMLNAFEKFLPKLIVSWDCPTAGMFCWIRIKHNFHPNSKVYSALDIEEEIFAACLKRGVLLAKGSWFRAEPDLPLNDVFFRLTFAASSAENMEVAVRTFGTALRTIFDLV
ncbi:aromatic amino acid aminotransferase [Trichoderma arundinaceum]|uniref:aromatic-amino-acid transaminase n=1 Tax=Trichoderma arundinaceum TaxID=490622 RepID=A0A395NG35_TRIAR|nr:aromatic amino acid aminotransferase [Trichoderma arundinaceum]